MSGGQVSPEVGEEDGPRGPEEEEAEGLRRQRRQRMFF